MGRPRFGVQVRGRLGSLERRACTDACTDGDALRPINDGSGGYRLGGYGELPVPQPLRSFAEVGWTYARPASDPTAAIPGLGHRVLPETGVSLSFFCYRDARGRVEEPVPTLIGPHRSVHFFAPDAGFHIEAVRLKSEWCRSLLGIDPAEHADTLDPFPQALARRFPRLRDRLARTRNSLEAVGLLWEVVADRAQPVVLARSCRLAHAVLDPVRRTPESPLDLADRSAALGVTERHLRRVIRETTGRGPKYFQRVRRLHYAVSLAEATPSCDWAALAARAGYYDQAHLIHEFTELTGVTPAQLRSERQAQQR
jgi:AraC-like DNA-binding protein